MSTVIIEKYVDGVCVEQLQIPAKPLQILSSLLPGAAKRELTRHGLDLDALLHDPASPAMTQWMDIEEKDVAKRIRICRHD